MIALFADPYFIVTPLVVAYNRMSHLAKSLAITRNVVLFKFSAGGQTGVEFGASIMVLDVFIQYVQVAMRAADSSGNLLYAKLLADIYLMYISTCNQP